MSYKPPEVKTIMGRANKCGLPPDDFDLDAWEFKDEDDLTAGEEVIRFAYEYLVIPEGPMVGQPLRLDEWQRYFVLAVFDNPVHTRKAIASVGRRNGKTFLISAILLSAILGPQAVPNSVVCSAAGSRDQAALAMRLMSLMIQQSPKLDGLYRIVPSSKRIIGLSKNVEFYALSADAGRQLGKSIRYLLLDEAGIIRESDNEFLSMLRSSQGSYNDARLFIVSTQAPSDSAFLSLEIDASIRESPDNVVTHVYSADEESDLMEKDQWYYANPGLGVYRSESDLSEQIKEAVALPAKMPGVLNLLLNKRVSLDALAFSPAIWKENMVPPDLSVFQNNPVYMGLDLSQINDLSVACLSARDEDGKIHVMAFSFSPLGGIEERSRRDRVPYDQWSKTDILYAPPGDTLNYGLIAQYLKIKLEDLGIMIDTVYFDRYRIEIFKAACEREGFCTTSEFVDVGQGFVSMGSLIDGLETFLLERRLRLGNNPVLNLGAASAIVEQDNVGNRRLTKRKSANKIDGVIALLMSLKAIIEDKEQPFDISALVG